MEELIAANQLFCVLLFGEVSYIRKWSIHMKKKVILKSSILVVAAGLSVFAINSVFADELPVQFMGVNDFHGALEQTGTARLEGETVRDGWPG